MILNAGNILLIGSILLFTSIIAGKAGFKFGVPALLLFLGVGMLFGNDGLGIQFNNPEIAQFIGVIALSIILFSGGMDTKMSEIKPVVGQGIVLATFGVMITALITGYFIYQITGLTNDFISLTFTESLLLAAVMSSTDSASVFSILRSKRQGLKENLRPLLELESGSNDPMAYMLTILLIQVIQSGESSISGTVLQFIMQMSIGAVSGYLLGHLARFTINKININQSLYSVLLLAFVFFIFSFTDLLKGNGYLAVYIAGLMVGNHKMVHKKSLMTFFDGFTWLFQIVMFLTLGLLVNPADLIPIAGLGILVGIFMIIVARPLTVFLCLLPFRKMSAKSRVYVSWVGLRGAVPIIFATYPLIANIQHASLIFNVVFFITILSLVIQGTTVSYMAKFLGLSTPEPEQAAFNLELPEDIKTAMSEIEVTPSMLAKGELLMDLVLPDNTLIVMVKRVEGSFCVPKGKTKLHEGDKLLVITDNDEELKKTYESLGIENYSMQKNS
ncbi:potassium/proton antiporter [Gabonibacter chumensis]|uniref:potassium/proton antiporter n=1 Tax=Gabonibacter chumensis TaxID=2972474 RepID=UPI0025731123|nr:potassium/proton antiporter [Gabonibacter chumensis]MCR9012227.1 potassium/proton antiporter [Gabonibacter chumensis]